MVGMAEMTWKQKKTNAEGRGTNTQGLKHYPLVPSQYRRGRPTVKGLRGCGLVVGGKMVYFRVPAKAFFEKNAMLG